VAVVRVAAIPVVLAGERLVEHPELGGNAFDWLLGLAAIYAIGALIGSSARWGSRVPGPAYAALDLALLMALTYTSGGPFSQLRFAFFLLPVGAAFLMSARGTAVWSAVALLSYVAVSLPHPATRRGRDVEFILTQALYLAWIGLAAVLLAAVLSRRAARIEELAAARGRLVAETLSAEERGRKHLAEALHDEAIQELLAAGQDLDDAERGDGEALRRAHQGVRRSIRQLREAIFDLHPYVLEHAGLEAALRSLVDRQQERGGAGWSLSVDSEASGAHDRVVVALARELIANAARHAEASQVSVEVRRGGDQVVLEVVDDGRGFDLERADAAVSEGHLGLASSAERAEAVGGRLVIADREEGGTLARASLPFATPGTPEKT
jgi:two-component system NarL family sensor kinase